MRPHHSTKGTIMHEFIGQVLMYAIWITAFVALYYCFTQGYHKS